MAAYFFDSSALVKCYIVETGTIWARTIAADQGAHSYRYRLVWRMRSNNLDAGSSLGSWGTSSPRKALARMDCVNLSTCAFGLALRISIRSVTANTPSLSALLSK